MMAAAPGAGPHLSDAELMTLLDEPSTAADDSTLHLDRCGACADAMAQLRSDAALLSDWLGRAAFEDTAAAPARAPVSRFGGLAPWLKAAAVLALVAGPVAAFPSLREWVGERLHDGAPAPAETAARSSAASPAAPHVIRFAPAGAQLSVSFDVAQAAASLTIAYGPGDEAVLEVTGSSAVPVVSERMLRVRNGGAAPATYRLQVPESVRSVTVTVGGVSRAVVEAAELREGAVLSLAARR